MKDNTLATYVYSTDLTDEKSLKFTKNHQGVIMNKNKNYVCKIPQLYSIAKRRGAIKQQKYILIYLKTLMVNQTIII